MKFDYENPDPTICTILDVIARHDSDDPDAPPVYQHRFDISNAAARHDYAVALQAIIGVADVIEPISAEIAKHADLCKTRVRISTDEHRVADEVIAALAPDTEIYSRGPKLVRPCDANRHDHIVRPDGSPTISPITPPWLRDRITRRVSLFKGAQEQTGSDRNQLASAAMALSCHFRARHLGRLSRACRDFRVSCPAPRWNGSSDAGI